MNRHPLADTSSFTVRDEAWFAAAQRPRPVRIESAPPSLRLGDSLADAWFRSCRPRRP
jgi:hypothetical protein